MHKSKLFFFLLLISLILLVGCSEDIPEGIPVEEGTEVTTDHTSSDNTIEEKLKILYIMSYHSPWEWTDSQFEGFKHAMELESGVDVEYRTFQMDTKNRSSEKWKEEVGQEARELIDTWQPDLVYSSDDNAQQYVTSFYKDSDIPFVFSAVNNSPESYGFDMTENITGVLEIEHFTASLDLFRQLVPEAKHIVVIIDESPMWNPVMDRIRSAAKDYPNIEFDFLEPITTFDAYKSTIEAYEGKTDGLCLIGIFNFADDSGNNVPYDEVLSWTAKNSTIPDFSFWIDRMAHGTLCGVTVSGYEQGYAAGLLANDILVGGISPADLPITPTTKGEAAINIKRAQDLGIEVDSQILISANVYEDYSGE